MELKPISVLVIDGDEASRNYLTLMLHNSGYTVLSVSLGREGLISAWKDQPDIIIMDPILPDLTGVEILKRLRQDHRTADVPCIALSSRENAQDMNDLLAAGTTEYITKSNQAMGRILEIIPRLLKSEVAAPKKRGILTVFLSAKGGSGTSSLCANTAMCLGSENIETRVAVVDLVLPIGSIASLVGYNERLNIVTTTLQDPTSTRPLISMENLPRVTNWYFHLLAGSPDPESASQLVVARVEGIINQIIESYEYILVDVGRTLSSISLPIIKAADAVVFIVGTDLSTAILTQTVWEYLKNQGVDPRRLYTLQNRSVGLEGLSKTEFEEMTGLQIRLTIPYMNENITIANNRHEPLLTKYPNDSSSLNIKQAALQIAELGRQSYG
jgi:CheY-like chemotaxis protein/MinD-like ATPase involved in chromosome partitioning or flagellar assembly